MDENKHNKANHHLVTSENTIWLPPSFINNKTPVSPTPQQAKQNKKELLRASSLLESIHSFMEMACHKTGNEIHPL